MIVGLVALGAQRLFGQILGRIERLAAVDVLGRVDELADGTGGSVDAVTGAAIGPYEESQFNGHHQRELRALSQERR